MMHNVISVVGPTASGKTALSVALANQFDAEIVSVDSMQIYKDMNIATAKVTPEEMQGIPHHMIDCIEPNESCSVQQFVTMARACVDDILARGKKCVLAGGTGLYVDHLISDTKFVDMPSNVALRAELNQFESDYLMRLLQSEDPLAAARLHSNDKKRIVRALEVIRLTKKSIIYWEELSHKGCNPIEASMIGLRYKDRNLLYSRIDQRVDDMIDKGLIDETERLVKLDGFIGSTASAAIGYREIISYLQGEYSLDRAIELIKQNTRRYAKRQITWFKRNPMIQWIEIDEHTMFDEVVNSAVSILKGTVNA